MSESAFPLAPQGEAVAAPVEESESESKRRPVVLVAGAAALLVLVVAGYFLFLRGGSDTSSSPAAVPSHHVATKTVAAAKKAAPVVPSTFDSVLARDPFRPLYAPPPPPPPVAGPTGTTATTTTTATTASSSQPVTLVKVYNKSGKSYAQTKVGNTVFTSTAGQTFAGTFRLLSTHGTSATYVQGDEQFSLSVGQVVQK